MTEVTSTVSLDPDFVALLERKFGPGWREKVLKEIGREIGREMSRRFLRSMGIHRCRRGRWWRK